MSLYQDRLEEISRTDIGLMVVTLDRCQNVFGVSPCTATGEPCYYSYLTCKDKENFNRGTQDYKYTSSLSFHGARPYIADIKYFPTEISDRLTRSGRATVTLRDEPDGDVGIDPHVTQRASYPDIPGDHFRKLVARNPNYPGRPVAVYEGFKGFGETDFVLQLKGKLAAIKFSAGKAVFEIEDTLVDLSKKKAPEEIDCRLAASITAADTTATLDADMSELEASGYLVIDKEIIHYSAKDDNTGQITGLTRGVLSEAAAHNAGDKVGKVRHYKGNPFDILLDILQTDAGIETARIDTTAFAYYKDFPERDIDFEAFITKPETLKKLYFEVCEIIMCHSWQNEDGKITIKRNVPNEPDRQYVHITDRANIQFNTTKTDLNDDERITRFGVEWEKDGLGAPNEEGSYSRRDVAADAEAEGDNFFGEQKVDNLLCRWLRLGLATDEETEQYAKLAAGRILRSRRQAMPLLDVKVELKDLELRTGQDIMLSTPALCNPDGTPLYKAKFRIMSKRRENPQDILLRLRRHSPERMIYIAPNDAPDYDQATEEEREKYGYISPNDGYFPDGEPGYFPW